MDPFYAFVAILAIAVLRGQSITFHIGPVSPQRRRAADTPIVRFPNT
jgi:hypothetical protein